MGRRLHVLTGVFQTEVVSPATLEDATQGDFDIVERTVGEILLCAVQPLDVDLPDILHKQLADVWQNMLLHIELVVFIVPGAPLSPFIVLQPGGGPAADCLVDFDLFLILLNQPGSVCGLGLSTGLVPAVKGLELRLSIRLHADLHFEFPSAVLALV